MKRSRFTGFACVCMEGPRAFAIRFARHKRMEASLCKQKPFFIGLNVSTLSITLIAFVGVPVRPSDKRCRPVKINMIK